METSIGTKEAPARARWLAGQLLLQLQLQVGLGGLQGLCRYCIGFRAIPSIKENQLEQNLKIEMETGMIQGVNRGLRFPKRGLLFWSPCKRVPVY